MTREVVRRARAANRGGRILFSTSLNGSRSEPLHTLYDASKGAVNALCRQLAVELAPLGFTTAAVAPGFVETPLTDFGLKSNPAEREAGSQPDSTSPYRDGRGCRVVVCVPRLRPRELLDRERIHRRWRPRRTADGAAPNHRR